MQAPHQKQRKEFTWSKVIPPVKDAPLDPSILALNPSLHSLPISVWVQTLKITHVCLFSFCWKKVSNCGLGKAIYNLNIYEVFSKKELELRREEANSQKKIAKVNLRRLQDSSLQSWP